MNNLSTFRGFGHKLKQREIKFKHVFTGPKATGSINVTVITAYLILYDMETFHCRSEIDFIYKVSSIKSLVKFFQDTGSYFYPKLFLFPAKNYTHKTSYI